MLPAATRMFAIMLSLAISAGNIGLCAGWAAAPGARMACCMEAEGGCGMHAPTPADPHGRHHASQQQADACCAVSEGKQTSQSSPTFTLTIGFAVIRSASAVSDVVPVPVLREPWRFSPAGSAASVPHRVLHSVFLV
jgi:hypothetical protein